MTSQCLLRDTAIPLIVTGKFFPLDLAGHDLRANTLGKPPRNVAKKTAAAVKMDKRTRDTGIRIERTFKRGDTSRVRRTFGSGSPVRHAGVVPGQMSEEAL